ncbi:MAG: response regulator transcription factor [Chloroflexota bacterium]
MRDRVLVVDDDVFVRRFLQRALTHDSYDVTVADSGESAIDLARQTQPAVILLDIMLPDVDGITLCAGLRAQTSAIIIMLTARRELATRVAALDLGADDYVTKPFELAELLARVRALLRRHRADGAVRLRFADLVVDPLERAARRGTRQITLTPKEFDLLLLFMRAPRRVFDRATIFAEVWPDHSDESSNTVEVHLHHLREKLHGPGEQLLLHFIRGAGYSLRESTDR